MTTRDDLVATLHDAIINGGVSITVNQAVRTRLLNKTIRLVIGGAPKYKIVDMLNKEARALDADVHAEAVAIYQIVRDAKL